MKEMKAALSPTRNSIQEGIVQQQVDKIENENTTLVTRSTADEDDSTLQTESQKCDSLSLYSEGLSIPFSVILGEGETQYETPRDSSSALSADSPENFTELVLKIKEVKELREKAIEVGNFAVVKMANEILDNSKGLGAMNAAIDANFGSMRSSLEAITNSVSETNAIVKNVAEATSAIRSTTNDTNDTAKRIESDTSEITRSTKRIESDTSEITRSTKKIEEDTEKLGRDIEDLKHMMQSFKTGIGDAARGSYISMNNGFQAVTKNNTSGFDAINTKLEELMMKKKSKSFFRK